MSEFWTPAHPCRPEVANCVRFILDSMAAQDIPCVAEQTDENPDVFSVAARDHDGYENVGLVGWDEKETVTYACYDPLRAGHDEREGVAEDDSKCWWQTKTAEQFCWFLDGTVRDIIARDREAKLVALDQEMAGDSGQAAA